MFPDWYRVKVSPKTGVLVPWSWGHTTCSMRRMGLSAARRFGDCLTPAAGLGLRSGNAICVCVRRATLSQFLGSEYVTVDWPGVLFVVRISTIYLFLYFLLRFVLKREAGALGLTDVLVIVLIADAVQNGMAGGYNTVLGGLVAGVTIVSWDYALSWLSFQSPRLRRLIKPGPLLIIKNGRVIERNLRTELITEDELLGELRLQGVESIQDVWEAYVEENGRISVIEKRSVRNGQARRPRGDRQTMG